jgi:hypothetical protein
MDSVMKGLSNRILSDVAGAEHTDARTHDFIMRPIAERAKSPASCLRPDLAN